jgi:hypothetical protein
MEAPAFPAFPDPLTPPIVAAKPKKELTPEQREAVSKKRDGR